MPPDQGLLCFALRTGFFSAQGELMRMVTANDLWVRIIDLGGLSVKDAARLLRTCKFDPSIQALLRSRLPHLHLYDIAPVLRASNGSVALVPDVLVQISISGTSYMSRNKDLVAVDTKPMIEGHIEAFSDVLTLRERWRALGKLYSEIGKGLSSVHQDHSGSRRYLFMAILLGYQRWDSLRFIVLTAPRWTEPSANRTAAVKPPLTRATSTEAPLGSCKPRSPPVRRE